MRGHVIVGVMTISTDVDKLYDTDLTDAAWTLIAPMLPAARSGGRPRKINIRAHMDCGAQLRLAWAQSTIEQGLRVLRAEL